MAPNLGTFDLELLVLIFELVDDSSPNTTKALACVSKYFNNATKLVVHRHKRITIGHTGFSNIVEFDGLRSWIDNQDVLRGLRSLTIDRRFVPHTLDWRNRLDDDEDRTDLTDKFHAELVQLIKRLGKLKELSWAMATPVPLPVLEALHKYQKMAKLKINSFTRTKASLDEKDPTEQVLSSSPALHSISGHFWNDDDWPDLREAAFRRAAAMAPNLESVSISQGRSGCVVRSYSKEEMSDLDAANRRFETFYKRPNPSVKSLTLDGFPMAAYTLKVWGEAIDLSKLESFACGRASYCEGFFDLAATELTGLKHISLDARGLRGTDSETIKTAADKYFATCSPLKSIAIWSWTAIPLPTILQKHGLTLEKLTLHEQETTQDMDVPRRTVLGQDDVRAIREACPRLRDLTIDMHRHTTGLEAEFERDKVLPELAKMKLDRLQLYYDLGLSWMVLEGRLRGADREGDRTKSPEDEPTFLRPSTSENIAIFVRKVWEYMFGSERASGSGARCLEVKFGEWERKMGLGYPAHWVIEEAGQRTRWVVLPHERDDRKGECVVTPDGAKIRYHAERTN